jgi:hypothetical protein
MQISNSNNQAAIIANQTSRKPKKVIQGVDGKQEALASQKNYASNKKSNSTEKALIYEFGVASSPNKAIANQKDSEITKPEFDSGLQYTSNNRTKIRGKLVSENQNFVVATAIDTYARHQELEHSEHVSQVMGVDLYA